MRRWLAFALVLLLAAPASAQRFTAPTSPTGIPYSPGVPGLLQPPATSATSSSVTASPDVTVTGTFVNPGDAVVIPLSGRQGVGYKIGGAVASTFSAGVSFDGGVTYTSTPIVKIQLAAGSNPVLVVGSDSSSAGSTSVGQIIVLAGATHVELSCNTIGAGTVAITLTATASPGFAVPLNYGGFAGTEFGVVVRPIPTGQNITSFGKAGAFGLPLVSPLALGGTPFTLRSNPTSNMTPPVVTQTQPPQPVYSFSGTAIAQGGGGTVNNVVLDNVVVHVLGPAAVASTLFARVVRRHVLYASEQTTAPAAAAAPTGAVLAYNAAPNAGGTYQYKCVDVDIWGNEGNYTVASANVSPGANQGVTVTCAALGAGAAGHNVYRTVTGPGATFFYIGRTNGTVFRDITADSALTLAAGTIQAWGTNPTVETLTTPVELVMEKFVALTNAPSFISTKTVPPNLINNRVIAIAPGTGVGRYRIPSNSEGKAFLTTPTITTALGRDIDSHYTNVAATTQFDQTGGHVAVNSFDRSDSNMAGTFVVWGHDLIGVTDGINTLSNNAGANQLAGFTEGSTLTMKWVAPPVFASTDEIVVEIGASATAAATLLGVTVNGRYF